MDRSGGGSIALLPTLTHARIRATQGDAEGARRILAAILAVHPDDEAARALLHQIGRRPPRLRPDELEEEPLAPPVPGDPAVLTARFRGAPASGARETGVVRLHDWRERIRKARERERAR